MEAIKKRSSLSVVYVFALTAIALILGWALQRATIGRVRDLTLQGVTVALPDKWLVDQPEEGGLGNAAPSDAHRVFTAWDPLNPATRYSISLLPAGTDGGLAFAASIRNLQRAQRLTAYRVLEQTPVTLKGRDGYRVSFAFVDASAMDEAPVVYQGVEYFFLEGDHVIVATLETSRGLADVLPDFQGFAVSAVLGE